MGGFLTQDEINTALKEVGAKELKEACPHCGRCPTCGQPRAMVHFVPGFSVHPPNLTNSPGAGWAGAIPGAQGESNA